MWWCLHTIRLCTSFAEAILQVLYCIVPAGKVANEGGSVSLGYVTEPSNGQINLAQTSVSSKRWQRTSRTNARLCVVVSSILTCTKLGWTCHLGFFYPTPYPWCLGRGMSIL